MILYFTTGTRVTDFSLVTYGLQQASETTLVDSLEMHGKAAKYSRILLNEKQIDESSNIEFKRLVLIINVNIIQIGFPLINNILSKEQCSLLTDNLA